MLIDTLKIQTWTGSSTDLLSTLPAIPPVSQDQLRIMKWVDTLPQGGSANFSDLTFQKHYQWQTH
eukprot:9798368-Prorocentrum_lima.AAC.1